MEVMRLRKRFPNPTLAALHPGILPGGVFRILLVGSWSKAAEDLLAQLQRAFPGAWVRLLTPVPISPPVGITEVWVGNQADPEVVARAQEARLDLVVPLEPYGLMGDARPELESFALAVAARAVAVYEITYGTVRIATRSHLRYRLYFRPWICRAFGAASLALIVTPLYLVYVLARFLGLWRGSPATEGES
jgi:hypothetical protein